MKIVRIWYSYQSIIVRKTFDGEDFVVFRFVPIEWWAVVALLDRGLRTFVTRKSMFQSCITFQQVVDFSRQRSVVRQRKRNALVQRYQLVLCLVMVPNVSKLRNSRKCQCSIPMVRRIARMGTQIILPPTPSNVHWVDEESELAESQGCAFLRRSQVPVTIRVVTAKIYIVLTAEFRHNYVYISCNLLEVVRQQKRTFFIHSNGLHPSNFPHSFHYFVIQPHALQFRVDAFVDIKKIQTSWMKTA